MNFSRPSFDFFEMGIKVDDILVSVKDPSIRVFVKTSNTVEYQGKEYSLTKLDEELGFGGNPCPNWSFNGKNLSDIFSEYYPKFNQDIFDKLKNESEMDPNIHDGSYELVQETVKAYKNVSTNSLDYLDLNCIYLMTVGTWKHSYDKKEETIKKSHLLDEDKTHLISILRKIQNNANENKYENRESGNPTCGMFGTGFYNFQTKTNNNSVRQFIKLCLDIISEDDEEKLFAITEEALKVKINGMQSGSISQILHCLKPYIFPVLNGNMRQDTVFAKLCIDIKDQKDSTQYISNCRKIKKFRDDNFTFKNYRIMDKIGTNNSSNNIWLLSWNEKEWTWNWPENNCDYKTWAEGTKNGLRYNEDWRCSNGNAKKGDEFYIIKTGGDPRGIFAHGIVTKDSFIDEDDKKRIGIEFDLIQYYKTEPIIPLEVLEQKCPEQEWSPRASGISIKNEYHETINELWEQLQENYEMETNNTIKYVELLKENKNLILHGAPGTGKTFLAKQIAEAMGCSKEEIGFCQFHPSYDYTDFVEGLRPTKNNGFERKDGTFKTFCKKALQNLIDSEKTAEERSQEKSIEEQISSFITDSVDNEIEYELLGRKTKFTITNYDEKKIYISAANKIAKEIEVKISDLVTVFSSKTTFTQASEIAKFLNHPNYGYQSDSYVFALYKQLISVISDKKTDSKESKVEKKNYVFIIDEINRGELSKIFGELFFSIDPGYRGEEGRVNTQYQNLIEDDLFKDGFYIPENVYIIGTMNDIDRSVESMDFAMRRRFIFEEVTAAESADNMQLPQDVKDRMKRINDQISKTEGLNSAYHIGAAYFRNVCDFNKLWNLKISSLVKEYLRGMDDDDSKYKKIKNAYLDELESGNATETDSDATIEDQ